MELVKRWTKDEDETLRKAAADGLSASQAGKMLGRTRSACLGRANRIKITFKSAPVPGKRSYDKATKTAIATTAKAVVAQAKIGSLPWAERMAMLDVAAPGYRGIPIVMLEEGHCRNVIAETGLYGLRLYCGAEVWPGSCYCNFHGPILYASGQWPPMSKKLAGGRTIPRMSEAAE